MTLCEIAERPASGFEERARSWLRIDPKSVGKMAFWDHLSNYGAPTFALAIGHFLAKQGLTLLPLLMALAFVALTSINIVRGLVVLSAQGTQRWVGAIALAFLVFALPGLLIGIA